IARRIERECAGGNARVEQIADRAAAPDALWIDAIHVDVALVPDFEPVLCIEHAETLTHVVQGAVETLVLLVEFTPAPARPVHRGDVKADEEKGGAKGNVEWNAEAGFNRLREEIFFGLRRVRQKEK